MALALESKSYGVWSEEEESGGSSDERKSRSSVIRPPSGGWSSVIDENRKDLLKNLFVEEESLRNFAFASLPG